MATTKKAKIDIDGFPKVPTKKQIKAHFDKIQKSAGKKGKK